MPDTSYLSLSSGSRLSNYLGLRMDDGTKYTYPPSGASQYAYIEIPVREILGTDGKPVEAGGKALRNQQVEIVPACEVTIRGSYRFEVHPCRDLWQFGVVEGLYYLEPGWEGNPSFHMSLRKDMLLSDIPYAVRIYMRA